MVEAGEQSGSLDSCIERAGNTFLRTAKLNSRVQSAMIYPMVVVCVMVLLVLFLLIFIVPQFADMYAQQGADLPGFTQVVVDIGDFVQAQWHVVIGAIVAFLIANKLFMGIDGVRTAWDSAKMRLPIAGKLITKIYAARFTRTLSSLNSAGVPIGRALDITARSIVNKHIEKKIYSIVDGINRGETLSSQLAVAGIFPPLIVHATNIGEESGTLDEMLIRAADFYDEEAEIALDALMALLEPLLIVALAIVVGPILVAVLLPMFGVMELMLQ